MKHVLIVLLGLMLFACEQHPAAPQWFSELDNPKEKEISAIIFSPADLKNAFTGLTEATYADTLFAQALVPVLRFEYYEFPKGPGIIFSLRCAAGSKEDLACVPIDGVCHCLGGKDTGTEGYPPAEKNCELVKEQYLPKWFCEGTCKEEGKTCFPLMLYDKSNRKSGGVAGCVCLPVGPGKPVLP